MAVLDTHWHNSGSGKTTAPGAVVVGLAHTCRLTDFPEFEIFESVVGPVTVAMVDSLVLLKWPAKTSGHDEAVLKDPCLEHRHTGDLPWLS